MRIPITVQLSLLVLFCSLLALMVLALATWFQNYNFITSIRLQGLSLTASLKAAQVASNLLLFQSSVQAISTRVLIQNALIRYNNGNDTDQNWSRTQTDLEGALSGNGATALLLQAVVFPAFSNDTGGQYGLVNVTGDGVTGLIKLPLANANGSDVYLGDEGLGYPPALYPNLTYTPYMGNISVNHSITYYRGKALTNKSIIFLGPYAVNESFSLFSVTMSIIANNTTDNLGWLSVVLDARMLYDIVDSPEGLDTTGQILLIGPKGDQNKFDINIRNSTSTQASDQQVSFVLPPQTNSTLGNRHSERSGSASAAILPFFMSAYPAVLDAWTKNNRAINNAGSMISTTNEEGKQVSVGYATVNSRLVDWTLVFEQAHSEVVSPINHLRDIVLACVFGTAGALCIVVVPIVWFSIAPIRQLRSATLKTVQPYQMEGSDDSHSSQESPNDFTPGEDGDEESLTAGEEARKEGFFGTISRLKATPKPKTQVSESSTVVRRRTFRIPGKVPERKHFIYDELTDLTSKFNEMSEELAMQYERLEERVKERTAELEQSKKNAEVANESKTLFIANISHELKTPLNGILGLCAVCMQEEDINKVRSSLSTIYKSGDLLLHLLTDLLTFSKNQIGQQLQIDESEFRLSDLGVQLMPIFEKQAREAKVNLEFLYQGTNDAFGSAMDTEGEKSYGPSGTGRVRDMCLWGDKNRILQVLMNFTSNSLKFTPANGSVMIRVRCIGLQESMPTKLGGSTRKTSINSKRSKQSRTSKTSKSSSKRNDRTSNNSLAPAESSEDTRKTEDSKLSINVAGGTTQIAKVVERRRSVSPPPLNTKDLVFEFEVEDTGPGIPDDQQQKIFEPFVQGDLGLSKKYGGTGLGLSICVQLAGLMGGGISLNSKVGEGSKFMMQIPLRFVAERAGSFASSHGRVDSKASSLVGQALYDANYEDCDRADSKVPMNSYNGDVLNGDKLADIPRIVGFTQPYLAKEGINESPKKKIEKMKKAETEAAKAGRKVRVLVAEDNQVNQEVVLRMLKLEDVYDVTIAKDGQEAFDKVRQSMDSGNRFNLVFMDVQMPNLDGIQSTKLIREMGFTAPIVALTAFAEKSNEEMCIASGMDHFLPKPIRRPALKQVLKKYCATIPEEEGEGSTVAVPRLKHQTHSNEGSPSQGSPRFRPADSKTSMQTNETSTPVEESISPLP